MMIIEITKQVIKLSFIIALLFLVGCRESRQRERKNNCTLIQEYKEKDLVVKIKKIDHGAYGFTAILQVWDKEKNLIEELGLRGGDYWPVLDSIIGESVYVHYSFPYKNTSLNFEDVVIGNALLKQGGLKYNYFFYNTPLPVARKQ